MGTAILLSVVVLLLAASVLAGLAAAWGKLNIADDYFLAGRQLPWYAVAISLAAAGLGLESLLGMAGLAYKEGMAPAALCWGNFLAYSRAPLGRRALPGPQEASPAWASCSSGAMARSTRAVYAAVMLAFMIFGILAAGLGRGGGAVCDAGLGRPPEGTAWLFIVAMVVVAAAAGVYSIYGGLAATTRAAMLQLLVVLAGGVLLVALGSRGLGGVEAVVENWPPTRAAWACSCPPPTRDLPLDRRAHVLVYALAGLCRRHAVERGAMPGARTSGTPRWASIGARAVAGGAAGRAGAAGAGGLRPGWARRHRRGRAGADLRCG